MSGSGRRLWCSGMFWVASITMMSQEPPMLQGDTTGVAAIKRLRKYPHYLSGQVPQLEKGTGIVVEFGGPPSKYSYNVLDTTIDRCIWSITDFRDSLRDGERIEFSTYPHDTVSFETWSKGKLHGPSRYYYANGSPRAWVIWKNDRIERARFFFSDGREAQDSVVFSDIDDLYRYPDGEPIQGVLSTMGHGTGTWTTGKQADLYFTNGRIDRMQLYRWAYWGKESEIIVDYRRMRRKNIAYNSAGLPSIVGEARIVRYQPERLTRVDGYLFAVERTELGTQVNTLFEYDDRGKVIKKRKYRIKPVRK